MTDGTIRPKYSPKGPLNRNQHQPAFEFNVIIHRRRKVSNIGGAKVYNIGGPRGGANSKQAHDVVTTSMCRNDVALTSFRPHVPTRFLINQCQIITFIILKSDIIENSRIELRGIALPVPSNPIKVTFIIILPFNLVHL